MSKPIAKKTTASKDEPDLEYEKELKVYNKQKEELDKYIINWNKKIAEYNKKWAIDKRAKWYKEWLLDVDDRDNKTFGGKRWEARLDKAYPDRKNPNPGIIGSNIPNQEIPIQIQWKEKTNAEKEKYIIAIERITVQAILKSIEAKEKLRKLYQPTPTWAKEIYRKSGTSREYTKGGCMVTITVAIILTASTYMLLTL